MRASEKPSNGEENEEEHTMDHDFRPALTAAIRSGANRRGALAAMLGMIPLAAAGATQADAARSQRHGKRAAKSEGKNKKKSKPGPPGPQGAQGGQGSAGAQGPTGPKAITAPLVAHSEGCSTDTGTGATVCIAPCGTNEIAVSGGFSLIPGTLVVHQSEMSGDSWVVGVTNPTGAEQSFSAIVYCLPK
jgi:hypothetical protein